MTTAIGKSTTMITANYNGVNKTAILTSVYPQYCIDLYTESGYLW